MEITGFPITNLTPLGKPPTFGLHHFQKTPQGISTIADLETKKRLGSYHPDSKGCYTFIIKDLGQFDMYTQSIIYGEDTRINGVRHFITRDVELSNDTNISYSTWAPGTKDLGGPEIRQF